MTAPESLQHFLSLDYEVRVARKAGRYELTILELGLRKSGPDMAAAYQQLMAAKEELITELCAQGLQHWITPPGGMGGVGGTSQVSIQAPSLKQQLLPFAIKAGVVAVLLLIVGMFIGNALTSAGRGLERDLHRIPEWSEEKVEKYRTNARRIVAKLLPIAQELRPLFDAGNATAAAGKDKAQ